MERKEKYPGTALFRDLFCDAAAVCATLCLLFGFHPSRSA